MTYTIDENGKAISETQDGVTMPIDYSFAAVNDFVHSIDTQYEDLESLCLGMSSHIDKLTKALEDIKKHQELAAGNLCKMSATWQIADKATKDI